MSNNGSTYTFNGLATNTRHYVTVTLINNASDINVFSESVKTLSSRCEFNCYFNASSYVYKNINPKLHNYIASYW